MSAEIYMVTSTKLMTTVHNEISFSERLGVICCAGYRSDGKFYAITSSGNIYLCSLLGTNQMEFLCSCLSWVPDFSVIPVNSAYACVDTISDILIFNVSGRNYIYNPRLNQVSIIPGYQHHLTESGVLFVEYILPIGAHMLCTINYRDESLGAVEHMSKIMLLKRYGFGTKHITKRIVAIGDNILLLNGKSCWKVGFHQPKKRKHFLALQRGILRKAPRTTRGGKFMPFDNGFYHISYDHRFSFSELSYQRLRYYDLVNNSANFVADIAPVCRYYTASAMFRSGLFEVDFLLCYAWDSHMESVENQFWLDSSDQMLPLPLANESLRSITPAKLEAAIKILNRYIDETRATLIGAEFSQRPVANLWQAEYLQRNYTMMMNIGLGRDAPWAIADQSRVQIIITRKAADQIHRALLEAAYRPGGPGMLRAKEHFEMLVLSR